MKFTETLDWILDKDGASCYNEEFTQQRIAFVHSLGLKCDCVGWSKLNLGDPHAPDILGAIRRFCEENHWGARGWYTREFAEEESDWYAIRFAEASNRFLGNRTQVSAEDGGKAEVLSVKACQDMAAAPKDWAELKLVPEQFREACIKLDLTDVEFCWAQDRGKYRSAQYFHIYPHHAVPRMAGSYYLHYTADPSVKGPEKRTLTLGGSIPLLTEIFYDLRVSLPNCYLKSDLPEQGFSSAYIAGRPWMPGRQNILIHKDTVRQLLDEKALSPSMLMPVPVLDAFPAGYDILDTTRQFPPTREVRDELLEKYEELKANPRPIRAVSEKDALKLLRAAKKERKEDIKKALPKSRSAELIDTPYAPLLPYYQIANGALLSDEYELLPYDGALSENTQFFASLQSEELLTEKLNGIVFAKCVNGDTVLLCEDGAVIRFSHEAPEITDQWLGLPYFFADALNT